MGGELRLRRRGRAMANEVTARAAILGRIRAATGGGSSVEAAGAAWVGVRREYRRGAGRERGAVIELMVDRLRDYDAQVLEVATGEEAWAIAKMLMARGVRRLVTPAGLRAELRVGGFEWLVDDGMSAAELNGVDGVLTECTLAIAETGTIVLQNRAGQGRRAVSLVPDYHLCVVQEADVVATVPEAMARLQETASLPTTFISGPSATADIEMTRIKGVHGPRFLDVVLVAHPASIADRDGLRG